MSVGPGRLFGLGGTIAPGAPADIAVFDLGARYRIESADFLSKGHATPFEGWEVQGRNVMTLVDGREVYILGRLRHCRRMIGRRKERIYFRRERRCINVRHTGYVQTSR